MSPVSSDLNDRILTSPLTHVLKRISRYLGLVTLAGLVLLVAGCDDPPPKLKIVFDEPSTPSLHQELRVAATLSQPDAKVTWRALSSPMGSVFEIRSDVFNSDGKTRSVITFTPDRLGLYHLQLIAQKGASAPVSESIEIDVSCMPPRWEVELSWPQGQTGPLDRFAEVDALLSSVGQAGCPDEQAPPYTLSWMFLSAPSQADRSLIEVSETRTRFRATVEGTYHVRATVVDVWGRSHHDDDSFEARCGAATPTLELAQIESPEGEVTDEQGVGIIGRPLSLTFQASDEDSTCGLAQPLTYAWTWAERPPGSLAALSPLTGIQAWFTPDQAGRYIVRATATDPEGHVGETLFTVEVSDCGSHPPEISAVLIAPESPHLGQPSVFTAEWFDLDQETGCGLQGDHRFSWEVLSSPSGSLTRPYPEHAQHPSFTPDVPGSYTVQVTVEDEGGRSDQASLAFNVSDCGRSAPIVTLSSSTLTPSIGLPFTLSAIAEDLDEACGVIEPLSLRWRVISAPANSPPIPLPREGVGARNLSFTPVTSGVYLIGVSAQDGSGHRGPEETYAVSVSTCGANAPELSEIYLTSANDDRTPPRPSAPLNQVSLLASSAVDAPVRFTLDVYDANLQCRDEANGGRPFNYEWTLIQRPLNSDATLLHGQTPEAELLPDVPGVYEGRVHVIDYEGRARARSFELTVSSCNTAPPQLSLTAPEIGQIGESVSLSVISFDPDSVAPCDLPQQTTYTWRWVAIPSNSAATLYPPQSPSVSFTPDVPGVYLYAVLGVDLEGHESEVIGRVEVDDCGTAQPVAQILTATPTVSIGDFVTLSASVSDADIDCQPRAPHFRYEWIRTVAPPGADSFVPQDRPIISWRAQVAGVYVFTLQATDEKGLESAQATQSINVEPCGARAPQIDAIDVQGALIVGGIAQLSASVIDPDVSCGQSQSWSYRWTLLSRPSDSDARFGSTASALASPSLSLDASGIYSVRLEVQDETDLVSVETATFTVDTCGSARPVAQVSASSLAPLLGEVIRLNGVGSDPDADLNCGQSGALTYEWRADVLPLGYSANLDLNGVSPSVLIERAGVYQFSLRLTDATGRTSLPATLSLNVNDCGLSPPQIEAITLTPATPQVGESARLSARTLDPDSACAGRLDEITSIRWRIIGHPAGVDVSLALGEGDTPTFTPPASGQYTVEAMALSSDGLLSAPSTIIISVGPCGTFTPEVTAIDFEPLAPRTAEPISLSATTRDQDQEGACALDQTLRVTWAISASPTGSLTQIGPAIAENLDGAEGATVSMTPDLAGDYTLTATVQDDTGRVSHRSRAITISECGRKTPLINAAQVTPADVFVGTFVQMSATATPVDLECEPSQNLVWRWRITERPIGSLAQLTDSASPEPQFSPDQPGNYTFSVDVSTPSGVYSPPVEVTLLARLCGQVAPTITAVTSPQGERTIGELLTIAIESEDPDEACGLEANLTPHWRIINAPIGSGAQLLSTDSTSVSFTPDREGLYVLGVRVVEDGLVGTGGGLASAETEIPILVGECGGVPPLALVGVSAPVLIPSDLSVELDTYACVGAPFIQLDAGESLDQNAACNASGPLTYRWSALEVGPGVSVSLLGVESETLNVGVDGTGPVRLRVNVTNEEGLTSEAYAQINATTLPNPSAINVTPNFFCAQDQVITLTGDHFYRYDDDLPSVLIGDEVLSVTNAQNCVAIPDSALLKCTELTVTIPAGLSADLYEVTVSNPYPLGCADETPPQVLLLSAPSIDQIAPDPICRGQFDGRMTLLGAGFFKDLGNAQETTIDVNGEPAVSPVISQCQIAVANLESCSEVSFELPLSQRDVPLLAVTLTNPNPGACAQQDLQATFNFQQSEPPQIDDIIPRKICDQGGSLTLLGDHFEPNMTVNLGPYRADRVNLLGQIEAEAQWDPSVLPRFAPGLYRVSARNATGCEETFSEDVRVTEGPVPFFVDPPIFYNGISLQATAYLGNLFGGSVTGAQLSNAQGDVVDLEFSFEQTKPSLLKLILPAGLPVDQYDLTLFDDVNCPGTAPNLLTVTDQLSVNLTDLTPPFAWNQSATSITAFASIDAGFIPTPRSYLSPSVADECQADDQCLVDQRCRQGRCAPICQNTDTCDEGSACVQGGCLPQASELRAASLSSITELKGTLIEGFAIGEYDFVVVNPDGSVGLLENAIKVNPLPPPSIDAVSPGSWEVNLNALPIQISGAHFRGVSVDATCIDGGQSSNLALNVIDEADDLINLTLNTNSLSSTAICSIRVTNDDDSYDDFSPLTTTNPSGNFVSFSQGPDLPDGLSRRLSALTFARIPNGPPALFLIGGDTGADAQALDDVLTIGIDAFGDLQTWETLPTTLPSGRTRTDAVTVGRFIYLPGGYDGATDSATTEVLRAEILDPLYVPEIDNVDFEFDERIQGLDTGVYYYRVSAIYGPNDPNNPNGESLPSEPLPVFIPDIPIGVRLVLGWEGLVDAVGYRVYRSPTPDLLFGQEELIAEVDALTNTVTDEGRPILSNRRPLNQGELGQWHVATTLNAPRSRHAVVLAQDPIADDLVHLYAIGGLVNGAPSRSYDLISIDLTEERAHQLAPTLSVADALGASLQNNQQAGSARSQIKGLSATPQEASLLSGGVFVYVLGGLESDLVEVAEVNSGGVLAPFNETANMQRSRNGYATAIANNTLIAICGQNGSASSTSEKGEVCGQAEFEANSRGCDLPEFVSKWSSLGNVGVRNCVNPGTSSAQGFFYLIGGGDGVSEISRKVDVALLGGTP